MQQALAAPGGSSQHVTNWQAVNNTFASEATYVFLDTVVTGLAASKKVQNWMGRQVAGKLDLPQGGSLSYDQAWKA